MRAIKKQDVQVRGYSDGSPHRTRKYIIIDGDTIDMSKTGMTLRLIPDVEDEKIAEPYSGKHTFPGATSVKEVPLRR